MKSANRSQRFPMPLLAALAVACIGISACTHVSRGISDAGVAEEVVFPDAAEAALKDGTFPNPDDLRLVAPGMTKDQLYQLLGRPHFNEGLAGVREWDYLFHFRKDGQVVTCQYKAIFDQDYLAQTFHWLPASCADVLKAPAAPTVAAAEETRFSLSADTLFAFAQSGADDILPHGREELDKVAMQLRDAEVEEVAVVGHADRIGSDAANHVLSRARAETVRGYLVGQGVPAERIHAEGRGESEPVKDCADMARAALIECLAPNRRVEIVARAKR